MVFALWYVTEKFQGCHYPVHVQEFEDPRDADDAVYEMNGREMLGERLVTIVQLTDHQKIMLEL